MSEQTPKRSPSVGSTSPVKRAKTENDDNGAEMDITPTPAPYQRGVAPIKAEYLLSNGPQQQPRPDDDAAEGAKHDDRNQSDDKAGNGKGKGKRQRGQNTNRRFGKSRDKIQLCPSRTKSNEFSPLECKFGDKCRFEHDLRKYIEEGKRGQMTSFGGKCPAFEARRMCHVGWKCRFVHSHSTERDTEDGRRELVLLGVKDTTGMPEGEGFANQDDDNLGLANVISTESRIGLSRRRIETEKANKYIEWLSSQQVDEKDGKAKSEKEGGEATEPKEVAGEAQEAQETTAPAASTDLNAEKPASATLDHRATFSEPPFRASEKRRLYYGPETPVLAPLTTQGNLPFRRLCVELGAQATFSEMAVGLPLVQGEKSEWALLRAHPTEITPPRLPDQPRGFVFPDYDHSRDLKFGAQIAANKPWIALKTTEVLAKFCPSLRTIDLNCGCPIDLIYRQGAGSALLDQPSKLEKMLRGMNDISGEIPISVKIRMGTRDDTPTAQKLVSRLVLGSREATESGLGPCGVAAITLHGRSRQQRYSRRADWSYISETAALIKRLQQEQDQLTDTVREPDARDMPNTKEGGKRVYFLGNGDCYSHVDYHDHIANGGVDSVMVARGALVKPWVFEEIETGQYLDKSATERLGYLEKFTRYGLETWGADEMGIGVTRRFLLEWLSFTYRYVPIGLLEHLPPHLNDRPFPYKGRNELETLMASPDYRDWIKLSEMFLGPAPDDFKFEPKHKSNSYEAEG